MPSRKLANLILIGFLGAISAALQAAPSMRPWPFYFLPANVRNLDYEELTANHAADQEKAYQQIVEAINTVALHAKHPFASAEASPYFIQINDEIKKVDPEAKLYLGPGTWQAILFGIMEKVHHLVLAGWAPQRVIDGIIKGEIQINPLIFLGPGQEIELIVHLEKISQKNKIKQAIADLTPTVQQFALSPYDREDAIGEPLPLASRPNVYFYEMLARGKNQRILLTVLNLASQLPLETSSIYGQLYFAPSITAKDSPRISEHSRTEYGFSFSNSGHVQDYLRYLASGFAAPLSGSLLTSKHGSLLRTMREYQQMPWVRIIKEDAYRTLINRYLKVQAMPDHDVHKIRQEIFMATFARQGDYARRKMAIASQNDIDHLINQMYQRLVEREILPRPLPSYVDQFGHFAKGKFASSVKPVYFNQLPSSTRKMIANLKAYPEVHDIQGLLFALNGRYQEQQKSIKVNNRPLSLTGLIGHKKEINDENHNRHLVLAINPHVNFRVLAWPKLNSSLKEELLQEAQNAQLKIDDYLAEYLGADIIIWNDENVVIKNTTPLRPLAAAQALAWQRQRTMQIQQDQSYLIPLEWQHLLDLASYLHGLGYAVQDDDIKISLADKVQENIVSDLNFIINALKEPSELTHEYINSCLVENPTFIAWSVHPQIWLALGKPELYKNLSDPAFKQAMQSAFIALPLYRIKDLWPTIARIIPPQLITQYWEKRIENLALIEAHISLKSKGVLNVEPLNATTWDEIQRYGMESTAYGDIKKTKDELKTIIQQTLTIPGLANGEGKTWKELLKQLNDEQLGEHIEREIRAKQNAAPFVLLSAKANNQQAAQADRQRKMIISRRLANINHYLASVNGAQYASITEVVQEVSTIKSALERVDDKFKNERDYQETLRFIGRLENGECAGLFTPFDRG